MYYITDRIRAIPGVQDVIPTKNVSQNGRFYVLVDKNVESKVRDSLQKKFDEWYKEVVPEDAKPKDGQFYGKPEVGTPKTDGYSSGDNSWTSASTKSFMTFSAASMATHDTSGNDTHLDSAWDNLNTAGKQSTASVSTNSSSGRVYASYASAAISDQMSGMTESDPRDTRHEELTNKIATLEAMITQLCQQVQILAKNASNQNKTTFDQDDPSVHREKRLDQKDSPRKHKKSQAYSASSYVEEDINEQAPMTEDCLTAWDDYLPKPTND
jgi:hypothetical protein